MKYLHLFLIPGDVNEKNNNKKTLMVVGHDNDVQYTLQVMGHRQKQRKRGMD